MSLELVHFTCNICGKPNAVPLCELDRETPSCQGCRSTVRMRAVVYWLVRQLFNRPMILDEIPTRRDIAGLGLSDWYEYAWRLGAKFSYMNTFFHQTPFLDITRSQDWFSKHDFLISSDVFEHVAPPVSAAFEGAAALLKPGGLLVLTVPYTLFNQTIEHFPDLFHWRLEKQDNRWVLSNHTRDGRVEVFKNLIFHGGEGQTLEMRVFCLQDILNHLIRAGFEEITIHYDDFLPFGIHWPTPWSLPITARRKIARKPNRV